jgi:hypothetical protein
MQASKSQAQSSFKDPIVTEVVMLEKYTAAEPCEYDGIACGYAIGDLNCWITSRDLSAPTH